MGFGDDKFELLLPTYFVESEKNRLREALKQFIPVGRSEIDYSFFYKDFNYAYFMQADLVREIRFAIWNDQNTSYDKGYTEAIIISNTCDLSAENVRQSGNKECLFAPLVDFASYISDLKANGLSDLKIQEFSNKIKSQLVTNIFYLPFENHEKKEFIVLLDHVFWFPTSELNTYLEKIEDNRITSLNYFGFYLFMLKLSYHLCRLPEEDDRGKHHMNN